jgi:hypothetical protein
MSAFGGKADITTTQGKCLLLTQSRHEWPRFAVPHKTAAGALRTLISFCSGVTAHTLLKIDGLIMPGFVELCTPHPVHALVIGPAEHHGRAQSNVEIA